MRHYTKDSLLLHDAKIDFATYRKIALTRAHRIKGPFSVETREGTLSCTDGWLALDADGCPYPIDAEVFARTYEYVDPADREKIK